MIDYVAGFLLSPDRSQVALVRKAKPAWQVGRWNGVGGKIEEGETPMAAMVREYWEEAGVMTWPLQWQHRVTLSFNGGRVYFFLGFSEQVTLTRTAHHEVEPVQAHQLSQLANIPLMQNLRWIIPLCMDADIRGPVEITDVRTPATNGTAVREKQSA